MGVIKKQAVGYSIINYLGVAIGSLSTIFLYPRDEQAYGLFRHLTDTANLIQPFAMLGAWYVGMRMFPIFKDEKNRNNGLWMLETLMLLVGSVFVAGLFYWFQPYLFPLEGKTDAAIFERYNILIIPLFMIYGYFIMARQYASNFLKVIFPSALDQIIKLSFPIIFILYLLKTISLDGLVLGVFLHFIVVTVLALWYLKRIKALSWQLPKRDFLSPEQWREAIGFAFYGVVGQGSTYLALRIDTIMISNYMGDLHDTGRFNIASLIGSNIAVPLAAITAIASPIISKAWNDNNLLEIKRLYQKSSENLLLIGLFLYGGVILCIHDLYAIMPHKNGNEDYSAAIMVVYIVGLKSVVDMATGSNDIIIGYSKHYMFSLYAILFMAVLNIVGCFYFIPRYGIIGPAISTFVASVLFNIMKFLFIKINFKLMPYTFNSIKILLINILFIILCYQIPNLGHPILNILVKGSVFSVAVIASSFYFNVSEDITFLKQQILRRLKGFRI